MKSQKAWIIKSANINFRRIKEKDLEILRDWRNSKGIREFNRQFTILNMVDQSNWYKQINKKNSDRVMFMITDKMKRPIGICGLIHLNLEDRCADVAIIIGEQKLHGKGIGSKALYKLIKYGFERLNLHRIGAEIFEYNTISIKLFEKLFFKHEATQRDSLWRNGRWWNVHIYSCLRGDYKQDSRR